MLIGPDKYCDPQTMKQNKIGNRRKPRPEILDKTISIICELYPINWYGRYMLQKPRDYNFGYHKPVYSWIPYGQKVMDEEGKPRVDAKGKPLVYDSIISNRPTFGSEYYYSPYPPPLPTFDLLIQPYIEQPFIPDPPSSIKKPPSFHYQFYTSPSGLPPLPLYIEETEASVHFTYNHCRAIVEYNPSSRPVLPPDLIKASPWSPPQGTVQTIHPLHTSSPGYEPKVELYLPFSKLLPIPAHSYRDFSQSDLAIIGHLKLCSEIAHQMYIPPFLYITPNTSILIAPDRTHPNLPILNMNKLKEPVIHIGPMPKPSKFEIIPKTHGFNLLGKIPTQSDAEKQKDSFLYTCHKKSSSSSLSEEEKATTPTVAGTSWQTFDNKVYHFSDSSVTFLEKDGGPDLDALSKKYFIHAAMFDLHAYQKEWKAVTDQWPRELPFDYHFEDIEERHSAWTADDDHVEEEAPIEDYSETLLVEDNPSMDAVQTEEPIPEPPPQQLVPSSSDSSSAFVTRNEFAEFKQDVDNKLNLILSLLTKKD